MLNTLTRKRLLTGSTGYVLSLLLTVFVINLTAQTVVTGTVVDAASGEPLLYATVSAIGEKGGVYSDAEGQFSLLVQGADSLLITMLGYAPLRTRLADKNTQCRLTPVTYTTEAVVVTDQKRKTRREKFGDLRAANYQWSSWWKGVVAHRVGASTTESGWLTKVFYRLDMHGNSCSVYARVRLFANAGDRPGAALLTKNILVRLRGGKNKYSVDLREENIAFPPGGLYVGIEFLEPGPDCAGIGNSKRRFYVKMAEADSLNSWVRPLPGSTWRQLGGTFKPSQNYNACIGAEVLY